MRLYVVVVTTCSTISSSSSGTGATVAAFLLGVLKAKGNFILGTGEGGTAMVGANGDECVLRPRAETAGTGSGAMIVGAGGSATGAGAMGGGATGAGAGGGGAMYPGGRVTLTTTSG